MVTFARGLGLAALLSALLMWLPAVQAQQGFTTAPGHVMAGPAAPPIFTVYPDVRAQQAAANIATLGRAYSFVPPYALGYNPYTPAITGYAPPAVAPPVAASPYYNPYYAAAMSSTGYGTPSQVTSTGTPGAYGSEYGSSYTPYTPYYQDPLSGYLTGAASVIGQQAKFMKATEEAKLLREQVRQARLETRRKVVEEWLWERNTLPTLQDEIERTRAQFVRRSQNNPTFTEVLSGSSLNDLLEHAAKMQVKGKGPTVTLDEDTLRHINVTTPAGGNIGVLKNDQPLNWPQALQGPAYEAEREKVKANVTRAVNSAKFGAADAGSVSNLTAAIDRLRAQLNQDIFEIPTTQYIEGMRFVRQLDDAVKVLKSPNAANYFNDKFMAKGKTVAELVDYMAKNGLRFAPAVDGDEAAYAALQHALATYDVGLQGMVTKE